MPQNNAILLHAVRSADDWRSTSNAISAALHGISDNSSGMAAEYLTWLVSEKSPLAGWLPECAAGIRDLYALRHNGEQPPELAWDDCLAAATGEARRLVGEGEDLDSWMRWRIAWGLKTIAQAEADSGGDGDTALAARMLVHESLEAISEGGGEQLANKSAHAMGARLVELSALD